MIGEERLYQFGEFVFSQKHELKITTARQTKNYSSTGVFDGKADDFGFDRRFLQPIVISVEHTFADSAELETNWDNITNKLLRSGKQPVFFSCVNDRFKLGDPIIKYQYGNVISIENDFNTKHKKLKYEIELDSPFFFDGTGQIQFLDYKTAQPNLHKWTSAKKWTDLVALHAWTVTPTYTPLTTMSVNSAIANFDESIDNPKGQLFLVDKYFFDDVDWEKPTFFGPKDFSVIDDIWVQAGDRYQTGFSLSTLDLDGSMDNSCFILSLDLNLPAGGFLELINENNKTGIRFENITERTIFGLTLYNHQNLTIFENNGKKLNTGQIEVTKTIPDEALDFLKFDTNFGRKNIYPSIRLYGSQPFAFEIGLKNQRIYY